MGASIRRGRVYHHALCRQDIDCPGHDIVIWLEHDGAEVFWAEEFTALGYGHAKPFLVMDSGLLHGLAHTLIE